ncbi:unnamed protein product [Cylicocyclus nassatus]|uniref:Abnormal cell migration protein 18-like fibronectin type I domain-containing protein n=1 Tax=Cylicocyclus nassatus TaxID=53992 RepID=A0AA36MDV8_CYLNA|nr:unnamed protein product [Cylicocyclus nassatus]
MDASDESIRAFVSIDRPCHLVFGGCEIEQARSRFWSALTPYPPPGDAPRTHDKAINLLKLQRKLWQFLLMRVFFIVLAFLATAHCLCKVRGRDRDEDEKWVDGSFLMQCLKVGEWGGWRTTILACMVDNKQIAIGSSAKIGRMTYICEDAGNGSVRIRYYWE